MLSLVISSLYQLAKSYVSIKVYKKKVLTKNITYFLRYMVLTKANSTIAENRNIVQPRNQISLAFM